MAPATTIPFFFLQEKQSLGALLEKYKPSDVQPPKLIFAIIFCKLCELSYVNVVQISYGCLILGFSFVRKGTEKDGRQPWVYRGGGMERSPRTIEMKVSIPSVDYLQKEKKKVLW